MSDIIVTVPKDQVDHFYDDKVPSIDAWWYTARQPRKAGPGDWIGFVFEGAIRYVATIDHFDKAEDGRIEIHFVDAGWISPIEYVGFRGFRYFDLRDQLECAECGSILRDHETAQEICDECDDAYLEELEEEEND